MPVINSGLTTVTLDSHNSDSKQAEVNLQKFRPDEEKHKWVNEHAYRLKIRWERWQKPLSIDSQEYYSFLRKELSVYYDDPLRRLLIESLG